MIEIKFLKSTDEYWDTMIDYVKIVLGVLVNLWLIK